jgi:TPR repeat protein
VNVYIWPLLTRLTLGFSVLGCAQIAVIATANGGRAETAESEACTVKIMEAIMASKSEEFVSHLRQTCPSTTFGSAAKNVPPSAAASPPVTANVAPPNLPGRADAKRDALAAYQAQAACIAQMRQAIQAGASEVERAGIVQDCIARSKAMSAPYRERQLGDDQGLPGWIVGINYEKAGRYAEAAAVYQKTLNDEGYPNGDGLPAGERLGYLYANGRGVPKDAAKARQLFSANQTLRNRDDLLLLNHHMLPLTPEGKTPALIEKATAMVAEEQRKALEEQAKAEAEESRRAQAWRTSHPELARAQDCRASCEQAVQSCTTKNLGMNWQVPFGGWREREYDCNGYKNRCYARCP